MKLKPIVASMFLLGLVSAPVLASADTDSDTQSQLDAMKAKIAKMEAMLDQNHSGTGLTSSPTWFNNITVSGLVNVDAAASNRTPGEGNTSLNSTQNGVKFFNGFNLYNNADSSNINLTDAELFIDAQINDWTKAHLGFDFGQEVGENNIDNLVLSEPQGPTLDEGYITIGNFSQSPVYFLAGREYVPFGNYDRYAIVPTLTQLLTETQETAVQLGVVDASGFNGAIYTFRGTNQTGEGFTDDNTRTRVENYGVNLGFGNSDTNSGYNISLGYLANLADVNFVDAGLNDGYTDQVGGLSASLSGNVAGFDAKLDYVTALRKFDTADSIYEDVNKDAAKPWAAGIDAGYSFLTMAHQSRFGLSYQQSGQAADLGPAILANEAQAGVESAVNYGNFAFGQFGGMPQRRYQAEYNVNLSPATDLGFVLYHDQDYSNFDLGSGSNATTGVVRLGVKFA